MYFKETTTVLAFGREIPKIYFGEHFFSNFNWKIK